MRHSPIEQGRKLTDAAGRQAERAAQLAEESVRIARELHEQGIESDDQLARAEELAGRVVQAHERIQGLAGRAPFKKAKLKHGSGEGEGSSAIQDRKM